MIRPTGKSAARANQIPQTEAFLAVIKDFACTHCLNKEISTCWQVVNYMACKRKVVLTVKTGKYIARKLIWLFQAVY